MKWIDEVRGSDSLRAAARRADITSAKLIRQVNEDHLSFETVLAVARAYSRPVLADLLRTGHLRPEDTGTSSIERALHAASDEQLVLETARRLGVADASGLFDKPLSDATEQASNVHQLRRTTNVSGPAEADDSHGRRAAHPRSEDRGEDHEHP